MPDCIEVRRFSFRESVGMAYTCQISTHALQPSIEQGIHAPLLTPMMKNRVRFRSDLLVLLPHEKTALFGSGVLCG